MPSSSDLFISLTQLRNKRGTKWTRYPADVIPAWIADMDFLVAPEIRDALRQIIDTDDFGYTPHAFNERVAKAFCGWMTARHGWTPDPARIFVGSTMMQLMHAMVMMFSEPGDGVIVQTPIYPGFLSVVSQNNRRLDENPLRRGNAHYEMDLDGCGVSSINAPAFCCCATRTTPTGRAFRVDELRAVADIALEHNLVVVADEVQMDFVYPPARYTPFASPGGEIAARTITLSSTSKGLNVAGLRCAVAHFGSAELQTRFKQINTHILGTPSIFSIMGSEAAWNFGGPTLDKILLQLDANRRRVGEFVQHELPGISFISPEATYFAWLDCSGLNLQGAATKFFLDRAKVALSPGGDFSSYTDNFARLNFATSPEILEEILSRMANAVNNKAG